MSVGSLTTDLVSERVRDLHREAAAARTCRGAAAARQRLTVRVRTLVGSLQQVVRVHLGPADTYVAG